MVNVYGIVGREVREMEGIFDSGVNLLECYTHSQLSAEQVLHSESPCFTLAHLTSLWVTSLHSGSQKQVLHSGSPCQAADGWVSTYSSLHIVMPMFLWLLFLLHVCVNDHCKLLSSA